MASPEPSEPHPEAAGNAPDAAYDADGVDRTLIRAMLDRSPLERLERLEGFAEVVLTVRERNGIRADR